MVRRAPAAGGSTGGGQRLEVVFDLEVEVQPRSESWTNKKTNMGGSRVGAPRSEVVFKPKCESLI